MLHRVVEYRLHLGSEGIKVIAYILLITINKVKRGEEMGADFFTVIFIGTDNDVDWG